MSQPPAPTESPARFARHQETLPEEHPVALLDNLPESASLTDLMIAYPDMARLALPLAELVLRGPSPLSPALREARLADIETAPLAARERPLFRYLRKLTLTPGRMTAEDACAVRGAGWSDDALHGVVAVSALHNFFNRWVDGCGVTASAGDLRDGAGHIAARGYQAGPAPGAGNR